MNVLAYGEDALTLWAIKEKFQNIVCDERIKQNDCSIFFRPSFGRGGRSKAPFGEFDFIIFTKEGIYLGESKWDSLSKPLPVITLEDGQKDRHEIFKLYMDIIYI